jgi:thiol-disulfide isomerase/thioredoxin
VSVPALLLVLLAAFLSPGTAAAADDPADAAFWYSTAPDGSPRIKVYFYWTSRCEHCRAARPFMEELPQKQPFVDLISRPTEGSATNARLQYMTATALGADPVAVPAIFFCGEAQIGYDTAAGVGAALVQRLEACRSRLVADPSLLTRPLPVIPKERRAQSGSGGGSVAAIVIGALFVALVLAGIVLSRKTAAAKERAIAAKKGDKGKRRKK